MGATLKFKNYTFTNVIGSSSGTTTEYVTISNPLACYTMSPSLSTTEKGSALSFTLTLKSGYTESSAPTVTMVGGTPSVTAGSVSGVWNVTIASVTGNITITSNATASGGEVTPDEPEVNDELVTTIRDGYWNGAGTFASNNGSTVKNWKATNSISIQQGESVIISGITGTVRLRSWNGGTVVDNTNKTIPSTGYTFTASSQNLTIGISMAIGTVSPSVSGLTTFTEEQVNQISVKKTS